MALLCQACTPLQAEAPRGERLYCPDGYYECPCDYNNVKCCPNNSRCRCIGYNPSYPLCECQ